MAAEFGEPINMKYKILKMIADRLDRGGKQYGHKIDVHDGRNWEVEALEELLDFVFYAICLLIKIKEERQSEKENTKRWNQTLS